MFFVFFRRLFARWVAPLIVFSLRRANNRSVSVGTSRCLSDFIEILPRWINRGFGTGKKASRLSRFATAIHHLSAQVTRNTCRTRAWKVLSRSGETKENAIGCCAKTNFFTRLNSPSMLWKNWPWVALSHFSAFVLQHGNAKGGVLLEGCLLPFKEELSNPFLEKCKFSATDQKSCCCKTTGRRRPSCGRTYIAMCFSCFFRAEESQLVHEPTVWYV